MSLPASAPAPDVARPHDPYAALRVPSFRWFVVSLLAMTGAAQVQTVVVAWQIYAATRDPLLLGLTGLAEAVPFIGVALLAGHVADRADRRRVSLRALAGLAACALALLALTLRAPTAGARVALTYAVVFASGVARSFLQPARNALSADIVPRAIYPNAVAWRSSTWQSAAVVGPAAGGLLYGFAGAAVSYAVVAALMLVALGAMARVAPPRREAPRPEASVAESLRSGLRFVWRERIILGALSLDLFSVLFGGATALLPIFAADILHVGPEGLGALRAAPGARCSPR